MNEENLKKANDLQSRIKSANELLQRATKLRKCNDTVVVTNHSQTIGLEEQEVVMLLSIIEFRLNEKLKKLQAEFDAL